MKTGKPTLQKILLASREVVYSHLKRHGFKRPNPRTINIGWCGVFADSAVIKINSEMANKAKAVWLHHLIEKWPTPNASHCVVHYRGKYYDSECLHGVTNIIEIPYIKRRPWAMKLIKESKSNEAQLRNRRKSL